APAGEGRLALLRHHRPQASHHQVHRLLGGVPEDPRRALPERPGRMSVVTRAAVLGSPIAHSLSPCLHRTAYAIMGLSGWRYDAIECDEARLPGLLDEMGAEWAGLSLT